MTDSRYTKYNLDIIIIDINGTVTTVKKKSQ